MRNFFEKLANSTNHQSSSEHLKLLGKRAAGMYASKEVSNLNDAVSSVVDGEPLNRDQIARVVETANQETWKALFVEGGDRQVHFDPADSTAVLGELSVKPDVIDASRLDDLDFSADVPNQRPDDVDLAAAFGIAKDSPEYEALTSAGDERVVAEKTASVADVARYGVDNAASLLADAGETFYQLVKQAHLHDDHGILQISKAVSVAVDDPSFAKDIMQKVAERLAAEGVRFNPTRETQKVAQVLVVNHEHPLLQAASNLEKSAYAYYTASETHEKLAAAHRAATRRVINKIRGAS